MIDRPRVSDRPQRPLTYTELVARRAEIEGRLAHVKAAIEIAKIEQHDAEQAMQTKRFVLAAREMLPREQYLAIWDRAKS